MKSTIVVLALLVGGVVAAHAAADTTFDSAVRAPEPAQNTTIVKSSETMVGVSIATQTPTSIIIDPTQMFRWVEVQNKSGSDVVCGENNLALSTIAATLAGWVVDASTGFKFFPVVPGRNFYCQSKSVTAATRVTVFRGR